MATSTVEQKTGRGLDLATASMGSIMKAYAIGVLYNGEEGRFVADCIGRPQLGISKDSPEEAVRDCALKIDKEESKWARIEVLRSQIDKIEKE